MCIKFESRKICVAGNQCDNSDFDFHNAEHKELTVIKISSDERKEDCLKLKTKGTQASLGATVIAVTILLILSIVFISRVTVNVLVFVLRVVCVQYEVLALVRASPRCPWSATFPKMIKYFVEKKNTLNNERYRDLLISILSYDEVSAFLLW